MPNWCHNTLTVSGEADALAVFVEKVKTEEQPLTFAAIVPPPSEEELRALETHKPCTMCGAVGTLPESEEQAAQVGARWYDWMVVGGPRGDDRSCNVCRGSGEERVGEPGWYEWRCEHWGTKWDAAFEDSGPFIGMGTESMDVELSKQSQVATITPTVAVYKFDTAWAPPEPVIEAASEQHPELEFVLRFAEIGEGYAGEMRYISGLAVENQPLEVTDVLAPEEMWF